MSQHSIIATRLGNLCAISLEKPNSFTAGTASQLYSGGLVAGNSPRSRGRIQWLPPWTMMSVV